MKRVVVEIFCRGELNGTALAVSFHVGVQYFTL